MQNKYTNFGTFLGVCLLLQTFMPHVTESKPVPGRGGAIGGMALSGLAGMAIGHAVTNHLTNKHSKEQVPNGCYKQTIREPDPQDPRKYIETERLVCPSVVAAAPLPPQPMPGMPGQYAQPPQQQQHQGYQPQPIHPSLYAQQQQHPYQQINVPQQQYQPGQPQQQQTQEQQHQPMQPAIDDSLLQIQRPSDQQEQHKPQDPAQANAEQSVQAKAPQTPPHELAVQQPVPIPMNPGAGQPNIVGGTPPVNYVQQPVHPAQAAQPGQPIYPTQPIQSNQPAQPGQDNQVIVLSKKTGYYGGKSSSNKIQGTNIVFLFVMIFSLKWLF